MGHTAGPRGLVRAPLLAIALVAGMLLVTEPAFAADSAADVDSLWNQPEGVSPDSGWYFLQAGWDRAALALERDPARHSLGEIAQANSDLLNAYDLLARARTSPGPRPVPVIDPALTSLYGTVTGVKVQAPLGSLFAWLNQVMLTVEGRGTTVDIAGGLLRDFSERQKAAARGLPQGIGLDALWVANSERQQTMIVKIEGVAADNPDATSLIAALKDLDHEREALLKGHPGRPQLAHSRSDGSYGDGQNHQDGKP